MTDGELEALLDDLESDRAERKEAFTDKDKARQAVCAFANDLPDHRLPGVLFIGVKDSGKPVGLEISDQLLQNVASMRNEGQILPFPSMDVQKRKLMGVDVAVALVHLLEVLALDRHQVRVVLLLQLRRREDPRRGSRS